MKKAFVVVSLLSVVSLMSAPFEHMRDRELRIQLPEEAMKMAREVMHDQEKFNEFVASQNFDKEKIDELKQRLMEEQNKNGGELKEIAVEAPRPTVVSRPIIANERLRKGADILVKTTTEILKPFGEDLLVKLIGLKDLSDDLVLFLISPSRGVENVTQKAKRSVDQMRRNIDALIEQHRFLLTELTSSVDSAIKKIADETNANA